MSHSLSIFNSSYFPFPLPNGMLRRRKDAGPPPASPGSSASSTPSPGPAPGPEIKKYLPKPRQKRRNGFIFALGGLFGIFVALFFANQQQVINFDSLMDLNLDSLVDVIPQGMLKDAQEFSVPLFPTIRRTWAKLTDRPTNAKQSATTHSPWACTSKPKASQPNTPWL